MRELFLPFRRIRPLVFRRDISMEFGVPHASHRPFAIALFFLCALQPFFTVVVISSLVATAHYSRHLWWERARSFPRTRGSVLR
jgi:hypothetical protein